MKSRVASLRLLARHAPAVVVMPVLMPRYSGFLISRWVFSQLKDLIYPSALRAVH